MAPVVELLSSNNPVFSAYVFSCTVLILKMLAMSALTGRQRMRKKVRNSPSLVGESVYLPLRKIFAPCHESLIRLPFLGQIIQNNLRYHCL
jgi:hypothetical protein